MLPVSEDLGFLLCSCGNAETRTAGHLRTRVSVGRIAGVPRLRPSDQSSADQGYLRTRLFLRARSYESNSAQGRLSTSRKRRWGLPTCNYAADRLLPYDRLP